MTFGIREMIINSIFCLEQERLEMDATKILCLDSSCSWKRKKYLNVILSIK